MTRRSRIYAEPLAIESDYLSAFNQMALLHYDRGRAGKPAELDLAEVVLSSGTNARCGTMHRSTTHGVSSRCTRAMSSRRLRYFQKGHRTRSRPFRGPDELRFAVTISFRGYEDGKEAFERAVALRPDSYDAAIGLGTALRGLGQLLRGPGAVRSRQGDRCGVGPRPTSTSVCSIRTTCRAPSPISRRRRTTSVSSFVVQEGAPEFRASVQRREQSVRAEAEQEARSAEVSTGSDAEHRHLDRGPCRWRSRRNREQELFEFYFASTLVFAALVSGHWNRRACRVRAGRARPPEDHL